MKKPLSLQKFSLLLLATLANNSKMICLKNKDKNKRTACLPASYKQNIQNILCEQNGSVLKYSCLIDTEEYFTDHFIWEWEFSRALKKIVNDLNKNIEYDFTTDSLLISFTQEEVDIILDSFKNKQVKDKMIDFTELLCNYIYTREYKEKYNNIDEISYKHMRELEKIRNADIHNLGF